MSVRGTTLTPGEHFEYIGCFRTRPSTMAAIFAAFVDAGYSTKRSLSTTSSQEPHRTSTTLVTSSPHTGTVITAKAHADGKARLIYTSRNSYDY